MLPTTVIDRARIPGGGELRLVTHGGAWKILLDRNELMSSRMQGSEEALATMTLARLRVVAPRVLIGGYGMGFTLRAALAALAADAEVTVAELVPEIIEWARGPMAVLTANCLDDPRVTIARGDVGAAIRADDWDAILLDVDNGPDGLVREANNALYAASGLAAARAALRRGGILAVWSAEPDAAFARRLVQAGFAVEEVAVRARANGKGPRHVIWFARA